MLNHLGFECRPIVAGNFAKNEVTKYFDSEISEDLENADYIDKNGLFIGNHHLVEVQEEELGIRIMQLSLTLV